MFFRTAVTAFAWASGSGFPLGLVVFPLVTTLGGSAASGAPTPRGAAGGTTNGATPPLGGVLPLMRLLLSSGETIAGTDPFGP